MRLRAPASCRRRCRGAPRGVLVRRQRQAAAAAAAFPAGRPAERERRAAAAHHVPAQWRAARARHRADGKPDPVALKITGGSGPLTVLVNGVPLAAPPGRHTLMFDPQGPGFVRLTVMDAKGATDSVMVRLQ